MLSLAASTRLFSQAWQHRERLIPCAQLGILPADARQFFWSSTDEGIRQLAIDEQRFNGVYDVWQRAVGERVWSAFALRGRMSGEVACVVCLVHL